MPNADCEMGVWDIRGPDLGLHRKRVFCSASFVWLLLRGCCTYAIVSLVPSHGQAHELYIALSFYPIGSYSSCWHQIFDILILCIHVFVQYYICICGRNAIRLGSKVYSVV